MDPLQTALLVANHAQHDTRRGVAVAPRRRSSVARVGRVAAARSRRWLGTRIAAVTEPPRSSGFRDAVGT